MQTLPKRNLVSWQQVYATELLWLFGRLINNTDMHSGNLSLGIEGNVFKHLPIYNMYSMGFAPKSGGEVLPYTFPPNTNSFKINLAADAVDLIREMAIDFWERMANDPRISAEFSQFLGKATPLKSQRIAAKSIWQYNAAVEKF